MIHEEPTSCDADMLQALFDGTQTRLLPFSLAAWHVSRFRAVFLACYTDAASSLLAYSKASAAPNPAAFLRVSAWAERSRPDSVQQRFRP